MVPANPDAPPNVTVDTQSKPAASGVPEDQLPEQFGNQFEYWLACIGFAVGFGNVWRFPYMCYTSGGAVFFIPYLCCLFLIAIPMYLVETAYGQLIVCKLQHRYAIISKRWWGLSIAQILVCFFTLLYYITLMAWSVAYFFGAFTSPMPWIKEGADQATVAENLWNSDYFYKDIL